MVISRLRNQKSGGRITDIRFQISGTRKATLISLISVLYFLTPGIAKDFGVRGTIYPISEEDPAALIQKKLTSMDEKGELDQHHKKLQKKTKVAIERPPPVKEITKATKARVFYYDPTYVVREDLRDHTGKVLAKRGMKINPLETVSLSHTLLFFDGDDAAQVTWIENQLQTVKPKLILVKGCPLALAEELGAPVYFDQGGRLSQKLKIHRVPARVSQEGLRLKIEEIPLPSCGRSTCSADVVQQPGSER